jgi:Ulp1 family protease
MGLVLGQSNDKTFNVLRSKNVNSLQRQQTTRLVAILPSINCIELAQPFVDHFASSSTTIALDNNQRSYSTTTISDRFNLLLSANDLNDVVLSDSSLDKACQVRLRDLRRLLSTNEWLNDEIVNALISLSIRSTPKCDAFSSFIVKKLASNDDSWIERYQSFRGKTFQELLTEKIVRLIGESLFVHCINTLNKIVYSHSLAY